MYFVAAGKLTFQYNVSMLDKTKRSILNAYYNHIDKYRTPL